MDGLWILRRPLDEQERPPEQSVPVWTFSGADLCRERPARGIAMDHDWLPGDRTRDPRPPRVLRRPDLLPLRLGPTPPRRVAPRHIRLPGQHLAVPGGSTAVGGRRRPGPQGYLRESSDLLPQRRLGAGRHGVRRLANRPRGRAGPLGGVAVIHVRGTRSDVAASVRGYERSGGEYWISILSLADYEGPVMSHRAYIPTPSSSFALTQAGENHQQQSGR